MTSSASLPSYQSPLISTETARHHFLTRQGGKSLFPFASLNTSYGKGDQQEAVDENRAKIQKMIETEYTSFYKAKVKQNRPPLSLTWMQQTHSDHVCFVDHNSDAILQADALITKDKGTVLCIQTADCVPLFLHDAHNECIAAIHAGWKGALAGIIQKTIRIMTTKGSKASCLTAVIGPCIHQQSYQVNHSFYKTFITTKQDNTQFFREDPTKRNHFLFDLPGFCKAILRAEGVNSVDQILLNTYEHEDLFFSCRRAFHKNEPHFGNQASTIVLI